MITYQRLVDLQEAIKRGDIDPAKLTGFICKGELFIRAGTPVDVFTAYYGSRTAAASICELLGITDIEDV